MLYYSTLHGTTWDKKEGTIGREGCCGFSPRIASLLRLRSTLFGGSSSSSFGRLLSLGGLGSSWGSGTVSLGLADDGFSRSVGLDLGLFDGLNLVCEVGLVEEEEEGMEVGGGVTRASQTD